MKMLSPHCDEIKGLTCSIVQHLEQDEFESANILLEKRLTLLKVLDDKVNASSHLKNLASSYEQFLLDIKQQDNIQLDFLLKEKESLMTQSLQQKKTKTAISAYTSVKQG